MKSISLRVFLLLLVPALVQSFTSPIPTQVYSKVILSAQDDEEIPAPAKERGVSMDQDGKSNVWAIEPKMEVSTKSSEENTKSTLIAAGGAVGFVALAAGILLNLPDPNQF